MVCKLANRRAAAVAAVAAVASAGMSFATSRSTSLARPLRCIGLAPAESADKGRHMLLARPIETGQLLLREAPLLCGRCCLDACPCGCAGDDTACGWRVVRDAPDDAFSDALAWHAELRQRAFALADGDRTSVVRVSCLLALMMQAVAVPSLWRWLRDDLRAASDDESHPFVQHSASFAAELAALLPRPDDDETGASAPALASWPDEVRAVLVRVQSNQFRLGTAAIGLFRAAHLLEHSCAPNARLDLEQPGALSLYALRPIRGGEPATICYHARQREWFAQPAPVRRAMVLSKLGFECRCDACVRGEDGEATTAGEACAAERMLDGVVPAVQACLNKQSGDR